VILVWVTTFIGVVGPLVGVVAAAVLSWNNGFSPLDLGMLAVGYVLTGLGITVGFHRLFTHRSFETVRPVQFALGVLGSMAFQGPVLEWVGRHRLHHQHSDAVEDPHSPHWHGGGPMGVLRGLWHAHIGWAFSPDQPNLDRYAPDLRKSPLMRFVNNLFGAWAALGLIVPALIGGLVTQTWAGAVSGFLWGGLVRVFLVHHMTWSINSVCHLWGAKPYDCGDESRNNPVMGVIAFGEGWHNNHHAFPTSARHGLKWWEFDASYLVIRGLVACRLAWNPKLPATKLINRQHSHLTNDSAN
jgi:stearoyl-CoA desaturase (delta-9 desaturase)